MSFRIQIIAEGKKRKLIIKNCKLDDGGMISAKTNADEVSAPLEVNCKLTFITAFNAKHFRKSCKLFSVENFILKSRLKVFSFKSSKSLTEA